MELGTRGPGRAAALAACPDPDIPVTDADIKMD